jgi:hypothetical protein
MSKRTANLIVIPFRAEVFPVVHCAPQLARVNRKIAERVTNSSSAPRACDLRRGSVSGGESHRRNNGAATIGTCFFRNDYCCCPGIPQSTLPTRLFPCLCRNRCNYLPGGQKTSHALFHKQFFSERLTRLILVARNEQVADSLAKGFWYACSALRIYLTRRPESGPVRGK